MRLNLGSENVRIVGFASVDMDPVCDVDLVADARRLPVADGVVEEIWASHILEHLEWWEDPMPEWHRVLRPGGTITVAAPDVLETHALVENGVVSRYWLNCAVFGGIKIRDDQHPDRPPFAEGYHNDRHIHRQVLTARFIIDQMRPWFPDARAVNGSSIRDRYAGEAIITGTKEN